jgi:serine/threonine-protein kinase
MSTRDESLLPEEGLATEVLPASPKRVGLRDDSRLTRGTRVGQYVVEDVVGEGGGGTVYSAQRSSGERVALKVLRPEMAIFPGMITRFTREAEAVRKIGHPNIVSIHELGELAPGRPYYAMELLEGKDLRTLLREQGRLSPDAALAVLAPVLHAVRAAHEADIIHRDLKASNVFVSERDGQHVIKLLDFGIAKSIGADAAAQPGITEPGSRLGTAQHMAPEQVRAEPVDARTDVYALGVLLFQALTGQYPFHAADPHQVAMMHLNTPPPRPSAFAPVSAALDAVVLRCLEKLPERRFQSVASLLTALHAAVAEGQASVVQTLEPSQGIYLELSWDEGDDEAFEDLTNALELTEQELTLRGFQIGLRSANGVLGVRALSEAEPELARLQNEAEAREIGEVIACRPAAHPSVQVRVSAHLDGVLYRSSPEGLEVAGGPLLKIRSWVDRHRVGS